MSRCDGDVSYIGYMVRCYTRATSVCSACGWELCPECWKAHREFPIAHCHGVNNSAEHSQPVDLEMSEEK